jgi:dTDP-4-dehydrorhamnose 3,5-epimerase
MEILNTAIDGLVIARTAGQLDARGKFARLFCEEYFAPYIQKRNIVQINFSHTNLVGSVRGLHYQRAPYAEMKFVRCIRGRVWDVALDLRKNSSTFLKWHAQELSPENGCMLVVPEGCAHGFQVLEPDSEMLYLHTAPYKPDFEGGVAYNDPRLSIEWPLPITEVSITDQQRPLLSQNFDGLSL